jgi:hypothetical protein
MLVTAAALSAMCFLNSFGMAAPDFIAFLNDRFGSSQAVAGRPGLDCNFATDPLAARVLAEYGAMFAAADGIVLPAKCIFANSQEVAAFQQTLTVSTIDLNGDTVHLQAAAAKALESARSVAELAGVRITAFDPPVASRRDYNDSVRIWSKRVFPAMDYWVKLDVIARQEAFAMLNMPLIDQSRKVLEWEGRGYKFGTGRGKSIFSSCSPPGASQHLALIALDVVQYPDIRVRQMLNASGWYQTVIDDPGHFTYLGIAETKLPERGLKLVPAGGFAYWVPDIRRPGDTVTTTSD